MENREITVGACRFLVPAGFQTVKSLPEDPEGSVPLMLRTDQADCLVLAYSIEEDQALPRCRDELIAEARASLGRQQGIVEVETGKVHGVPYAFRILKSVELGKDGYLGMSYAVLLDILDADGAVRFQGEFNEYGSYGVRDFLFHEYFSGIGFDELEALRKEAGNEDPYDPEWREGVLLSVSEKPGFDDVFPEHPLSLARSFLDCVLNGVFYLKETGAGSDCAEHAAAADPGEVRPGCPGKLGQGFGPGFFSRFLCLLRCC